MNKDANQKPKQYDATNSMFVEYWAGVKDPNYKYAAIQYEKKDDGVFSCVVKIPLPKVEIHTFGKDLAELVYRTSNEAVEIIEAYMAEHPEHKLENKYKGKHLVIIPDDDGNDFSITTDEEYAKELYDKDVNLTKELKEDLKAVIEKIKKVNGSSKLAYVHIIDKRYFSDCDDNKKLMENVRKWINKHHGNLRLNRSIVLVGDSVLAFGYQSFLEDED